MNLGGTINKNVANFFYFSVMRLENIDYFVNMLINTIKYNQYIHIVRPIQFYNKRYVL